MQFTVPQFIDQEDKIIAFITVRQFLIMIVAAILIAVAYAALSFLYFVIVGLIIVIATGILAFLKVNGRPFHFFLISFVERTKKPNIRVWNKELTNAELRHYLDKKKEEKPKEKPPERPRLSTSQLSQLSLIVDTGGSYQGEDVFEVFQPPPAPKPRKK